MHERFDVVRLDGDLGSPHADRLRNAPFISWDIETSGLDWRTERIATCQLYRPGGDVVVVRIDPANAPRNLRQLLEDGAVRKLFHHAMFDLRFMAYAWDAAPRSVLCTKVASKLSDPLAEHSLQGLARRFLGIELDKAQRLTDWFADTLDEDQIRYAVNDVLHLPAIMEGLRKELCAQGLWTLATRCFDHIPTRVELELRGYDDPFTY